MSDIPIEQAIYDRPGGLRARSPGFRDDWQPAAERLCADFGERPEGVPCPAAVFATPFGKQHVAVVQVADQRAAGNPLGFRLLVIPRPAYAQRLGDPFHVAERFPPPWNARGELPTLTWPDEPPPARTVAEVRAILRPADAATEEGYAPVATLLGGAQALVDGGRLVFERQAPDPDIVRKLWALLPHSTRANLWPASFAFGNALGFHIAVTPRARAADYPGYLTEDQAGDYPEGRYEMNLELAAAAGDQRELDALFARRSGAQTFRLALFLLLAAVVLVVGMQLANLALVRRHNAAPPPPAPTAKEAP